MADTNRSLSSKEGLSIEGKQLITVMFSVEGILGVMCALYSLRRSLHRSRSGTVSFYTSLAVADLGIACLCPITAYASSTDKGWPFGPGACDAYGFFAVFFGSACIWSLLMSVVEEQYAHKGRQMSMATLLVVTWLNALFWSAAPIMGWGRYLPESYNAGCLYDMNPADMRAFTYSMSYPVAGVVVPIGILVYAMVTSGGLAKSGLQAPLLVVLAILACWGLYCVEQGWVLVAGNKEAIPIQLSVSAPITAKLSPIVNALVVGKLAGPAPSISAMSRRSYKND